MHRPKESSPVTATTRAWARTAIASRLRWTEALLRRRRLDPIPVPHGSTILVVQYAAALGYCVHNTPIFEALKRQRPDVRIAVATHALGCEVLRNNPFVDELFTTRSPLTDGVARSVLSLRAALRRTGLRPDVVVTDASNFTTRIGVTTMLAVDARRVGFTLTPELFDRALTYDEKQSLIANNLRVLDALDLEPARVEPRVFFSEEDLATARSMLETGGRPVAAVITQGSGGQQTRWHREHFAEVIRQLHARHGLDVVYVGVAAEGGEIEAIRRLARVGTSLAGRTSVGQLAAVISSVDLVISVDTGPMHIARCAGTPMVVLGPSWQRPIQWLPLGRENVRILRGADTDYGPPGPPGYMLDEIEPSDVMAAVDALLGAFPPADDARKRRVRRLLAKSRT